MTRTTTLAVAADYADALMTARRAKNWLFILVLLMILLQLTAFLLVKFKTINLEDQATVSLTTSDGSAATSQPARTVPLGEVVRYVTPVINFLGMALVIVLAIVLLLLVAIMLVGRLIGVSHVTSAFIWCVLLAVLMFPWQTFLIGGDAYPTAGAATASTTIPPQPSFKIPGVLYTYAELRADKDFPNQPPPAAILKWSRYVGFPVLAMLVLMMVQAKSSRGLRFALGEADVQIEVTARPDEPLL